jgi:tripartite-type tricarboxylate transporter receptor subunit TctC
MKISRRCFIAFAALLPRVALAQSYPPHAVALVVGFPPGGPNDTLGRLIADWLTQQLGQAVIVENRPGSSGNIATEAAAKAPADGTTLLLVGPANAINGSLFENLNFNFLRDIAPVAAITREPLLMLMLMHPAVPAKSVAEFITLAKVQPGKIKMASTGKSSSPHVSGLFFAMLAGVDLDIVQFGGGGPALKGMIAGEAQVMFEPMSAAIGPIRSGALHALAVTTAERSAALRDVPTVAETVTGYEASAVTGLGVPAHTPADIVERLNKEINAAFAHPAMKARLADTGGIPLPGSAADFGKLMIDETAKWAKVIKNAGAKL